MAIVTADLLRLRRPADIRLLRSVLTTGCRPNVFVSCGEGDEGTVTRHVTRWCSTPRHVCRPGGPLELPRLGHAATLVLPNVTDFALDEQIELCDWIASNRQAQVVSLSARPVRALVNRGLFLEGLYHRLNVVQLDVAPAARLWYPWAWTFEGISR